MTTPATPIVKDKRGGLQHLGTQIDEERFLAFRKLAYSRGMNVSKFLRLLVDEALERKVC